MTEATPPSASKADIQRYRHNLQEEVDGMRLYELLSEAERDEHLKEVYRRLAISEGKHRALWERKLRESGVRVPDLHPSMRVRFLGFLARRFGTAAVAPIVTQMERSATTMYDDQPEAVEHGLPRDERSHARLFREIGSEGRPNHQGPVDIARIEGRHRGASGNAVRAAVLGANDGLVSNLSLVMGVAGADPGRDVVLLAGIAGLLAGSLSMALGEWISVRSSAEYFEHQLGIEREELAEMPEEEAEELTLIYQAKGLSEDEARITARRILAQPETALSTLAREELGIAGDQDASAWVAATVSFLMFGIGALLPVLPWFFVGGVLGTGLAIALSACGLFILGALITFFTGRNALRSGLRMLSFGIAAAAITYGIGSLIGAATGI